MLKEMNETWIDRENVVGESYCATATEIPTEEGKPVRKKFCDDSKFESIEIKKKRILLCFISLSISPMTRGGLVLLERERGEMNSGICSFLLLAYKRRNTSFYSLEW